MNDIDRAVEAYTRQAFREYTENRIYTPEPDPIYCAVCGDVEVENKGNACDRCVDSDHDEMRAMAQAIRGFDMALAAPAPGSVVDPNQKASTK